MANPSDISYSIIKEVTAGTTPATPAFMIFPHVLGDNLQLNSENNTSQVLMAGRNGAGNVKVGYSTSGSLRTDFRRGNNIDLLLESGLCGAFSSNVLKASDTDTYLTVEKRFKEGGSTFYRQFVGQRVGGLGITVSATESAELSVEFVGMGTAGEGTTMITGATYSAAPTTKRLTGLDVSAVTIAGVTATYVDLDLQVSNSMSPHHVLGSANAVGVGMEGAREVTLSVTVPRLSYALETALNNDTAIAVSFTIGSGANGYTITLPAATCAVPQDEEDGSRMMVKLDFTAQYDATEATSIKVTKLS